LLSAVEDLAGIRVSAKRVAENRMRAFLTELAASLSDVELGTMWASGQRGKPIGDEMARRLMESGQAENEKL
jgi:hypothetical protein